MYVPTLSIRSTNCTKTFSHLTLPSHWFYLYRFFISTTETSAATTIQKKGKCNFVCGADLVSSRNHVPAPRDHPQTSLSTAFKCFPMKTVGQLYCFSAAVTPNCICTASRDQWENVYIYNICDVGEATL